MKTCTKCGKPQALDEFSKSKRYKDGLFIYCKTCERARKAAWNLANKAHVKRYNNCRRSLPEVREKEKRHKLSEKAKIVAHNRYLRIQPRHKAFMKTWRTNNKEKLRFYSAKRRASILNASPRWLTQEHLKEIEQFYLTAIIKTKREKIIYEVDHIIPLQGKEVCGLHVPWNLQLLSKTANARKGNSLSLNV